MRVSRSVLAVVSQIAHNNNLKTRQYQLKTVLESIQVSVIHVVLLKGLVIINQTGPSSKSLWPVTQGTGLCAKSRSGTRLRSPYSHKTHTNSSSPFKMSWSYCQCHTLTTDDSASKCSNPACRHLKCGEDKWGTTTGCGPFVINARSKQWPS